MKVVKSANHYTETALDEIRLCDRICQGQITHPGWNHCALLYDNFYHRGPNGRRMNPPPSPLALLQFSHPSSYCLC